MSLPGMIWACNAPVSDSNERLVLVDLGERHNPKGQIYCRQTTIAERTKLSERTVRSTLKSLEEKGLISRQRQVRNGHRSTDLISLNIDYELVPKTLRPKEEVPRAAPDPVEVEVTLAALQSLIDEVLPAENDGPYRQNSSEPTGTDCRETVLEEEPIQSKNLFSELNAFAPMPDPHRPETLKYGRLVDLIGRILIVLDGLVANPKSLFPIEDLSPLTHWLDYEPGFVIQRIGAIARWHQKNQPASPVRSWRYFDKCLRMPVGMNSGQTKGSEGKRAS